MSQKRKQMMKAWNDTYGLNNPNTRRLGGQPSSGKRITEDDPRWKPSMGRAEPRKRKRQQGITAYDDWENWSRPGRRRHDLA